MTNSADPDQLASSEANSDLHCLLRQGISCSEREQLKESKGILQSLLGINGLIV